MGSLSAIEVLNRLSSVGCHVRLQGEKLRVRGPNRPEVRVLVSELHREREAAIAFLRDRDCLPPSLEEVKAILPAGIQIVSYQPTNVPFAVAPVSVVLNAGKFFRAYLRDLRWRFEHPDGCAVPPLADIVGKLADAGLQLRIKG